MKINKELRQVRYELEAYTESVMCNISTAADEAGLNNEERISICEFNYSVVSAFTEFVTSVVSGKKSDYKSSLFLIVKNELVICCDKEANDLMIRFLDKTLYMQSEILALIIDFYEGFEKYEVCASVMSADKEMKFVINNIKDQLNKWTE